MNKIICDVCEKNMADKHFKVKQLKDVYSFGSWERIWKRIDICESCYEKLISIGRNTNGYD